MDFIVKSPTFTKKSKSSTPTSLAELKLTFVHSHRSALLIQQKIHSQSAAPPAPAPALLKTVQSPQVLSYIYRYGSWRENYFSRTKAKNAKISRSRFLQLWMACGNKEREAIRKRSEVKGC